MTMFCCDKCGCVDLVEYANEDAIPLKPGEFLCSKCRPRMYNGKQIRGQWHGKFPRTVYDALQHDVVNRNPYGISKGD